MAGIKVTEKDLSWYARQGFGSLIVYVPGVSTNGPTDRPTVCNSITQFEKIYGKPLKANGLSRSYNIAESFIKAGSSVLFHRFVGNSAVAAKANMDESGFVVIHAKYPGEFLNDYTVTVTKGVGTWSFTIANKDHTLESFSVNYADPSAERFYTADVSSYVYIEVTDEAPADLNDVTPLSSEIKLAGGDSKITKDSDVADAICKEHALDILRDPYIVDFDVATSAGFVLGNLASADKVDTALSQAVIERGTAIYLIDGTASATPEEFYAYCENFNSSFCVGIGPWGYAKYLNTGATALLPGSYAMIIQWIKSTAEGVPVWMAPAGVKRASLDSFYIKPQYEIGKSVLDAWQMTDIDPALDSYRVNPIMRAKSYGYIIYGNSTLLHSTDIGSTSMLQSVSTRVMTNVIKKAAFDISLSLQFDQMNGDLYAQFKTQMSSVMDQMRYQGAIYDYRILLDSSVVSVGNLNERKIPVIIQISPAPAVESFDITLEITKSGVTFDEKKDPDSIEESGR